MKQLIPIIAGGMLILGILACCPGTSTPPQVSTPGQRIQPTAAEPEEEKPVGSSRSNPAPPGSEVSLDDITLLIGEVVRPADTIIEEANEFNSDPDAGNEYLMLDFSATCKKPSDESCNFNLFSVSIVGSSGITHNPEIMMAGIDNEFEDGEFFGGATRSGWIIFEIGQDETDLVLIYDEFLGDVVYMAVD